MRKYVPLTLVVVLLVGVISAVGISQYQDYVFRSNVSEGPLLDPISKAVSELERGTLILKGTTPIYFRRRNVLSASLLGSRLGGQSIGPMPQIDVMEGLTIPYSPTVTATLKGKGFEIEPLTEASQAVGDSLATEWKWEVTATTPSGGNLYLTLTSHIPVEGRSVPFTVYTRTINVKPKIAWLESVELFLAGSWQWLTGTLLIPLFLWSYQALKKRRVKSDLPEV